MLSHARPLLAFLTLLTFCLCFANFSGGRAQPPVDARHISLVGALKLQPFNEKAHADVAGYKNVAFIGKWGGACTGMGVDIIDISNPATPVKIAATLTHANTSAEDMNAIQIGSRDVLAVGLQECGMDAVQGKSGLELYDITDPSHPQFLSFFDVDGFGADVHRIHELDLTVTPSGRALALAAVRSRDSHTRQ